MMAGFSILDDLFLFSSIYITQAHITDLFLACCIDAIEVQNHVDITAQFAEAVYSGAKRPDDTFWEICSGYVSKQRTNEEAQTDVLFCEL